MKELFIHIGLSKTGSSAIQAWLSLNNEKLAEIGIKYKDVAPQASMGAITSGNGVVLNKACENKNYDELEYLLKDFYFEGHNTAIISCEALQGVSEDSISIIKSICDANHIEVKVIAYMRSIYELLYSNYLQGIKRHGYEKEFGSIGPLNCKEQVRYIENYSKVFGHNFKLLNYDFHKNNICGSFSNIIHVDLQDSLNLNKAINRSLTIDEALHLKKLNKLHKGNFSAKLSDFLILSKPDLKTEVIFDQDIINKVVDNCKEDLVWINSLRKEGQPEILSVLTTAPDAELKNNHYNIMEELVNFVANEDENALGWVEFIRDWAISLEEIDISLSQRLMRRAFELRPDGPVIAKKIESYNKQLKN